MFNRKKKIKTLDPYSVDEKLAQIKHQDSKVHIQKLQTLAKGTEQTVKDILSATGGQNTGCHAAKAIRYLVERLKRIDFKQLSDEEAITLFDTIYLIVPACVENYNELFLNSHYSYGSYSDSFRRLSLGKIDDIIHRQANDAHGNSFRKVTSQFKPSYILFKEDESIVVSPEQFPELTVDDYTARSLLNRIRTLWETAREKNNTVEDKFFLEQTVTSYIPEAYKLYMSFTDSSSSMKRKATHAFREQLELIQSHLKVIAKRKIDADMNAVEVHTIFLRNVIASKTSDETMLGSS